MLLRVHPDTDYQAAVLNASLDYFLIEGRVAFAKPNSDSKATGRKAIMIVGLGCSTRPFLDMNFPVEYLRWTNDTRCESSKKTARRAPRSSGSEMSESTKLTKYGRNGLGQPTFDRDPIENARDPRTADRRIDFDR